MRNYEVKINTADGFEHSYQIRIEASEDKTTSGLTTYDSTEEFVTDLQRHLRFTEKACARLLVSQGEEIVLKDVALTDSAARNFNFPIANS